METNRYIIDFYNHYDEDSRLAPRTDGGIFDHHAVYRAIYPARRPVLEIGAGTGALFPRAGPSGDMRWTRWELVEHNIEVFGKTRCGGKMFALCRATPWICRPFPDRTYDIVLLLGPLYHLYNDEDKRQALREAIRVTKKGEWCCRLRHFGRCLLEMAFRHHKIDVRSISKRAAGRETFAAKSEPKDLFELVRKEDVGRADESFPSDPAALCGYRWVCAAAAGGDRRDGR